MDQAAVVAGAPTNYGRTDTFAPQRTRTLPAMPKGRRRDRRANPAEERVIVAALDEIMPNPVNPAPGPGWQTYVRNMPEPLIWAEEALARASRGDALGRSARTGGRTRLAEKIATLLHFGVHYEGVMAEVIAMEHFSPVKFWIWENTEGAGAEERMITLLKEAVLDWEPYVSAHDEDEVKDYAKAAITVIERILSDSLHDQVFAGMRGGRHSSHTPASPAVGLTQSSQSS